MMDDFSFKKIILEKKISFLVKSIGFIFLGLFLYSKKFEIFEIGIIGVAWIIIEFGLFFLEYRKRKKYFKYLVETIENLDKKYLLSECIDVPNEQEDKTYYEILKKTSKSMMEELSKVKVDRQDYKEYIEKWVHEIKTPIAATKLILENNKNEVSDSILLEVSSIEAYIEQALFYARSETLEKDYFVKEIDLTESINKVLIKNRKALILNNVSIVMPKKEGRVYSDEKWLEFIIEQIVNNAIKYKKGENQGLSFIISNIKNGICLEIKDYGLGIKKAEIGRVFEKGFTGSKGRGNNNSTGIGLYLVKKLCDKLGIIVNISSEYSRYTSLKLVFPKGEFVSNEIFEEASIDME